MWPAMMNWDVEAKALPADCDKALAEEAEDDARASPTGHVLVAGLAPYVHPFSNFVSSLVVCPWPACVDACEASVNECLLEVSYCFCAHLGMLEEHCAVGTKLGKEL